MNVTIRQQTPADYPVMADIQSAALPGYHTTAEELQRGDAVRDPKCFSNRLIAERDGLGIGFVSFSNLEWMYHPQRFEIVAMVLPQHRNQGIGSLMYDAALEDLSPRNPTVIRSFARDDMAESTRFLEKRGFGEEQRYWESRLDVASFDASSFIGAEDRLREAGIILTTFAHLEADPERDRKLYELETALMQDLPSPEPLTPVSYEQFRKHVLDSPYLLPDGWMVATHNGEYVGLSVVWKAPGQTYVDTGLTGVRREWRRHGIALAMKLRVVDYARRLGYTEIRTDNESNNVGMLSINERLGFVKQPVWIGYAKTMK